MKQAFNNKKLNKATSRKWIYAAAISGVLITGVQAMKNVDDGSVDAKAAKITYASSITVNVKAIYSDNTSSYLSTSRAYTVTLKTQNGKQFYDLSNLKNAARTGNLDVSKLPESIPAEDISRYANTDPAANANYVFQLNALTQQTTGSNKGTGTTTSSNNGTGTTTSSNNGTGTTENTTNTSANTLSSKLVPVTFYNHYRPSDTATLFIDPQGRQSIDVTPNAPAENSNVPTALTGQNVYNFLTKVWHADPKSLPASISLTDYNKKYEDYHLERPKVINFKDAKNNVVYSQTVYGADDHPMKIGEVLGQFQTKYKYAEADPNNPYVKDRSISSGINNDDNQAFDILVKYKMNIPISGNNQTVEIKNDSSTMSDTDFKAKLAEQGYQLVDDDIPATVDFSNPGSYSVKAITNSLPISFVDQHNGVVYSTNLPASAINQPISIQDVLDKVASMGVTPDTNNSIVQNKQVPAFYNGKFVSINVTAPVHKLTIKFIDKSNGNEVVAPLEKDNVTNFESFTIADKVNELKTKNYVPELSALASGFNSQTYDNFSESYVLNPAISVSADGTHTATIYVGSTEATTANTNKTGKGYPLSFKDANGNNISLTINSVNPTMTPKEFQKALSDQGYTLSQADVDKLGSNSVDLNKSDTGLTISNNSTSNNVHPIYVSYNDASGKNHTDVVNISSDNPTMSTDDLAKALSNQGYKLTDDQKNQLGQRVNFVSLDSRNPIQVTTNADANVTKSYSQSLEYNDGKGNIQPISVSIDSSSQNMSKDAYIKALSDKGYALTDDQKNKLPDVIDLTSNGTTVVTAKDNPQTSHTQTLKDNNNNDVIVHINSSTSTISADEYEEQLSDQGVTLSQDSKDKIANGSVDLTNSTPGYTVTKSTDNNSAKSYPQTVNVKKSDGNYVPTSISITSGTSVISRDEYISKLKSLGYDVSNKDNIPENVDLDNNKGGYSVEQPSSDAPISYKQMVVLPDNSQVAVYINSKTPTISRDDLAKALADQGYTLTDNGSTSYTLGSTSNPISVKPNAQAVTTHPQTVKIANGDGTFATKTVYIPSSNGQLTASEYFKAMSDQGYTISDPSALSDPLSVASDNINPVVVPNAVAHSVLINVDGQQKTINVGSQNPYLNKSDFLNAVSAQGYTISDPNSLPSQVQLDTKTVYNAENNNPGGYIFTFNSSDKTKSVEISHDTPLITKQDLIKQLQQKGFNITDSGQLNDIINLNNPDDTSKVASLIEGFSTYKMNVGVVGSGNTISISSNNKTISKQDFINRVEQNGYKVMNPDVLGDKLDLTDPTNFSGLIIAKAENVSGDANSNKDDSNNNESNATYAQDVKVAGSNEVVKVESANKTMTKDDFVKYLASKGYNVSDASKLPATIDLTKSLDSIEVVSDKVQTTNNNTESNSSNSGQTNSNVSNSNESNATYAQDVKVAGSNEVVKVESTNKTMTKDDFVKYLASKGYKVSDASKLPATIDLTKSLDSIEVVPDKVQTTNNNTESNSSNSGQTNSNVSNSNESNATYAQDVKVAGSNDVVKVESANKTMTKDEFIKYLASKGYKVSDASKLPATIDLTKSLDGIEVVSDKAQSTNSNSKDKEQARKTYTQYVKIAGSNKAIKVESANKTITKNEFIKYLAAKGYKVSDASKLPATIDLTKSIKGIEVVSKSSRKASKKDVKNNNNNVRNETDHRGQLNNNEGTKKLPQTGDNTNQSRSFGFGLISIVLGFILAIFGLRRKDK
ncbi:hypothetical protein AKUH4B412M_01480 [Apilactobacillus kunkeei]|nr:hypothetical protein AKUH4B412M_01480 [Apilactobacillus kunkeei]CAI2616945.1 hypothetical protein AKUH4B501J_01470 [Apilactobacillus kunkeei]